MLSERPAVCVCCLLVNELLFSRRLQREVAISQHSHAFDSVQRPISVYIIVGNSSREGERGSINPRTY